MSLLVGKHLSHPRVSFNSHQTTHTCNQQHSGNVPNLHLKTMHFESRQNNWIDKVFSVFPPLQI